MTRILIVEDDADTAAEIAEVLTLENYETELARDGDTAVGLLGMSEFDLVILDWGLPGKTGIEILQHYRKSGGSAPILMLTARHLINHKEEGFDAGADDYLTKPFHIRELRSRVKALLRRRHELFDDSIEYRHIRLDIPGRRVFVNGDDVQLNAREFALLELLLKNKERVFTLDGLIASVWSSDSDVTHDAVRQCIARLRKKIDLENSSSVITTLAGMGYKIEG